MNVIGGAVIIVWSFVTMLLLYVVLRFFNLHRATAREEKLGATNMNFFVYRVLPRNELFSISISGLDLAVHNQVAYNMEDRIERIDSTTSMSTMNFMIQQCSGITIYRLH